MSKLDRDHVSDSQADRILQRAAEIESAGESRPRSVAELRSIANEAGFDPDAMEQAISETLTKEPEAQ